MPGIGLTVLVTIDILFIAVEYVVINRCRRVAGISEVIGATDSVTERLICQVRIRINQIVLICRVISGPSGTLENVSVTK